MIVDGHGHLVPSDRANKVLDVVWHILEKAMDYSKSSTDIISPSSSLYDFFAQYCDSQMQQGILTSEETRLILSMSQMWGAYVGERVERQSLKFFFMEDCIEGSTARPIRSVDIPAQPKLTA